MFVRLRLWRESVAAADSEMLRLVWVQSGCRAWPVEKTEHTSRDSAAKALDKHNSAAIPSPWGALSVGVWCGKMWNGGHYDATIRRFHCPG